MYGIFLGVLFPKIGMFGCTTKFLFSKNYYYSLFTAQLLYKIGLVFTHFFLLKKNTSTALSRCLLKTVELQLWHIVMLLETGHCISGGSRGAASPPVSAAPLLLSTDEAAA